MKQSEVKSVSECVRRMTHPIFHLFDSFFSNTYSYPWAFFLSLFISLTHTRRSAGLSLFLNPAVQLNLLNLQAGLQSPQSERTTTPITGMWGKPSDKTPKPYLNITVGVHTWILTGSVSKTNSIYTSWTLKPACGSFCCRFWSHCCQSGAVLLF